MSPPQMLCPGHTELLPRPKGKFTLSCRRLQCVPVSGVHVSLPPPPSRQIQDGCHLREALPRPSSLRTHPCTVSSIAPLSLHLTKGCLRVGILTTTSPEGSLRCLLNQCACLCSNRMKPGNKHLLKDSLKSGAPLQIKAEFSRENWVLGFLSLP